MDSTEASTINRKLPNLFIIGAMKSGTSSLHEYLHQHPQIFMSRFKEPQYFAPHKTREGFWWGQGYPCPEPGSDWYLRLFAEAGDARYAGESSVSYTAMPSHNGCARRIHEFNPEARLVYIMRDPVERTISHYWHFVAGGVEDRPMLQAIERREEFIARSNYAMQLAPYFELFGAERVFTLTLEELTATPSAIFRQLFEWLGVDADVAIETDEVHNVGRAELWQTRRGLTFADMALRHWRWKRVEKLLPGAASRVLHRLVRRRVRRDELETQHTIEYLRPILRDHTAALERLLDRSFPEWKTLYPEQVMRETAGSCESGDGGRVRPVREDSLNPSESLTALR